MGTHRLHGPPGGALAVQKAVFSAPVVGDHVVVGDVQQGLAARAQGAQQARMAFCTGRKWARTDCMGRLRPRFTLDELLRTKFGSAVVCADRELVYEEAPQAYKDVDSVVASLQEAGLVQLVARLHPLLTYKK